MKFVLDASMKTGISSVDEQHELLFGMIEELVEQVGMGEERQAAYDALQGLKTYAAFHFTDEEELMRQSGFPKVDEHAQAHREFVQRIDDIEKEVKNDSAQAAKDLLRFLYDWLVLHIKGMDMAFVPTVKA